MGHSSCHGQGHGLWYYHDVLDNVLMYEYFRFPIIRLQMYIYIYIYVCIVAKLPLVGKPGIMCHNMLKQIMQLALPSWQSMLPSRTSADANFAASIDGATAFREKLQKKAWRAKLFLESTDLQESCVILTYLGIAVEPPRLYLICFILV